MQPTTRRGFLRVTAASAAVVTASIGLRSLAQRKMDWMDSVGGPDCPQTVSMHRLGVEEIGNYRATLLVQTPWEELEYRLEDVAVERGQSQFDVTLIYPYTTYQAGQYRYTLRLESEEHTFETSPRASFELSPYRWFV
jgi:hypothetical protein